MKQLLPLLFLLASQVLSAQCNASFTWDDTDITIQFMDQSTTAPNDPIVTWFWDFDDNGNTSNQQNPTYTFSSPDKYDVNLTITTQNGCMSNIEVEIETCVLNVSSNVGSCDANGNIPVMITVNDVYDNADEIDIILDGASVPGSPFQIDQANPVMITVDVPGDGLNHMILIQSTDIATCGKSIDFLVPDCNSNCFLSGLQVGYPLGVTHTVDVGNDFFSPVSTGMILGDIVHFNWIGDGHSTTSDVTSGPDAWNSGVISIGSTFNVEIKNPGIHPYYCIPHGGTGGSGMSGEILANCPTGNNLDIEVGFNTTLADPAGFNIYYDGSLVIGSPFSYAGTGPQLITFSIAGDGNPHPLLIEDVADPTCILSTSYDAPDCGQGGGNPVCSISVSLGAPGGCDANQNVLVDGSITVANGGTGFNLSIDNGPSTFYTYNGPNTTVSLSLPGDGQSHSISVTDDVDPTCTSTTSISTPNCNLPCTINNLTAVAGGGGGQGVTHTVNVEDFSFNPSVINITVGDQVEWIWTGAVAHTATSDATSGPDSWDSGLLNTGASYTSPVLTEGTHPYYCVPHGSPGGVGMAGTVFVLPPCNAQNEVMVSVNFDITSNGTNGFEILVDGSSAGTFPYAGGSAQSASVNVPGDNMSHTIAVRDVDDPNCTASTSLTTPDCNGGGTAMCMIDVVAAVTGGCNANNEVLVDLTVTASDQGSNFTVEVDGQIQGTYAYTGSTTIVSIDVIGDGQSHSISVTDDVDPTCTSTTTVSTPNCNLPCNISNMTASAAGGGSGGGTIHTVDVEDFIFNPSVINITLGDQVEWIWTGAVAHTATSDATSGPDSWDSGLLNTGASYTSPVLTEGTHPYYCVPHGSPGGVGMAGTVFVLPPCNAQNEVMVSVNFDITSNGTNGFEILVDGSSAGTFPYAGGSAQSASVNVPGDNMSHTIAVRDVDDPNCTASTSLTTPDCNGGGTAMCMIDVVAAVTGGCNANNEVLVDLTVTASDQGSNFTVEVDGQIQGTYAYTGSTTVVSIDVIGDGQSHSISVTDDVDPTCTSTTTVSTPNCNLPCNISNMTASAAGGGSGGGTIHTVDVEDFIFNPSVINITLGDQVEWIWTGAVAHTATSDATSGPDSWDSGLLNTGASYTSPVLTEGTHPYYCVPHGSPGGVGMAGTVFVLPPCNAQNEVMVTVNFDITSNGTNGFEILVDGSSAGTFPYAGGSAQSASVNVPGDNISHTIAVRDVDDPNCTASTSLTTPDCNGGGTAMCMIDVVAAVTGGCNANNEVPVDLTVTASDQGSNFTVEVDGQIQGTYAYTGSTTVVSIDVLGDGQNHSISVTDDVDPTCTSTTTVSTPNCNLPCNISNMTASAAGGGSGGGTIHTVDVEDFIFNPSVINITVGDQVEWIWTGAVAHTATSDATSGSDSWDSGLLNTGASYTSPVLTEGTHPYYCVPHGSPGGVGMAGTVFVLPPCNAQNEVMVTVNFDITSNGTNGFEILVDGTSAGTFAYVGGSAQSATVNVPGDNMSHTIAVRDVDDPNCTATTSLLTPDCNGGGTAMCMVDVMAAVTGGCNFNNEVPVELTVTASDQGNNFAVEVDGQIQGTYAYTGSTTVVTIDVVGDGQSHSISVTDDVDPSCTSVTTLTTPNCQSGCSILGIDISFGENRTHIIQVEDFEFIPDSLSIVLGDTIIFDWTGIIPHTATSDNNVGPDAFDSDLLSQGATYQFIPSTLGDHPYYCVPHGAPGGIGMAGNINVTPACDGLNALANISIQSEGSSGLGFDLFLDGNLLAESPIIFNASGNSTGTVLMPGDSMLHTLLVSDVDNPSCADSITFYAPLCEIDSCNTEITNIQFGVCDGANVDITIDFTSLQIEQNHHLYINDNLVNMQAVSTDGLGNASYTTQIAGVGGDLEVVIRNILYPACADTMLVSSPDCAIPCLMSNVSIGSENVHRVEVRDFDFFPRDIEVLIGDTVRFVWTGNVSHTTTSDATSGSDTWDSGLFGQGHVFDIVIQSEGPHPYYCIPHGGPGGIGMAGSITAIDTCDGEEWLTGYSFTVSAGSPLGYNIFINGEQWNSNPIPYEDPTGENSGMITLPGDARDYLVTFQDLETDFCAFTNSVLSGQCGADCTIEDLVANVGKDVVHEVEVRDFDFLPLELTARVGETIRFIWTGDIPHTTTSDALSGLDAWDSGLLTKGDTFDIVIQSPGTHPYYCIPHGGPGGIGQSGQIYALPECEEGKQEVAISFIANGGSTQGYKLFVDGNLTGGLRPYTNVGGINQVSELVLADGQQHIITIQDDENPICAASSFYQASNCRENCEMGGLAYDIVSSKHTILVRDFDYLPLDLTIELGDTLVFDWVGDIPHTVTSDNPDGPNSFNSGLLSKGDKWILVLEEVGSFPYYCIPHGGPGGIGMAGALTVVDACEDDEVKALFTFTTSQVSGTYDVLVNGVEVLTNQVYSGLPLNTFELKLAADNRSLEITVVDKVNEDCNTTIIIDGIDCGNPCFDLKSEFDYNINFSTKEVQFIDNSSGSISSWFWEFGDGSTSTDQNPSHSFGDFQVYEVCLTVSDGASCMSTICDKIRFSSSICTAGFTFEQNDLNFTFINTSDYEDADTEILWTFGDGNISDQVDSTHHDFELGIYTVCIQISSDSCESNYCEDIDLSDPCLLISPDFETDREGNSLTFQFKDMTSGSPDSWLWGFGDGATSTDQNPMHTFESKGAYNICLFVQESEDGCSKSICKKIDVGNTTGVIELERYKTLHVYPNPSLSQEDVIIDGFSSQDIGDLSEVSIWSSQGRLMKKYNVELGERLYVDEIDELGVYLIEIITLKNRYRSMFVKL